MLFGDKILKYKDELLADLNTLIGMQSIDGKRDDECDRALKFIIKRASDFGLFSERVTDKSAMLSLAAEENFAASFHTLTLFLPETTGV